jgi:hypothetical protein
MLSEENCLKRAIFVATVGTQAYDNPMAKAHKFDLENPAPILDEEDEETLCAIDEGVRDAQAGRTISAEEVRKRLPKWITASSTRKERQTISPESSAGPILIAFFAKGWRGSILVSWP